MSSSNGPPESDPEVPDGGAGANVFVLPHVLPRDEYDGMLVAALVLRCGADPTEAEEYVLGRWPMGTEDALSEIHGRGLVLEQDDLRAWLRSLGESEDIPALDEIVWSPSMLDEAIEWCVQEGRGRLYREVPESPITRAKIFELLRSEKPVERLIGGKFLGFALGADLRKAGETQEDYDHIIAPPLGDLLARAMYYGDPDAIDWLDSYVEQKESAMILGAEGGSMNPDLHASLATPDGRLHFSAEVELTAGEAGKKPVRINIRAYSGGIMEVRGFGPVVIDVEKLIHRNVIAILADHDASVRGIVGSGTPTVVGGALYIGGVLTSSPLAERIVELARAGVLQASIGAKPLSKIHIRAGETFSRNGQNLVAGEGGVTVITSAILQEVSVLPLAADDTTHVSIAARNLGRSTMGIEDEIEDGGGETGGGTSVATGQAGQAVQGERMRIRSIRAACGSNTEVMDRAIDAGWDINQTKAALYDHGDLVELREGRARVSGGPMGGNRGSVGGIGGRDRLIASLILAGGHDQVVKTLPGGEQFLHATSRPSGWGDLCAMALRLEHRDVPSNRADLIAGGFSTSALPTAIGSSLEKTALSIFLEQTASWLALARRVPASNFREGGAVRLATSGAFEQVAQDGEIKHGALGEDAFRYKLATWAQVFTVTRQMIINDDMSILADLPAVIGNNSARCLSDLFYKTLTTNLDRNNVPFYSAGHNNLLNLPLDMAGLTAAITRLRTRVDADGRIIGIQPAFLLVPAALEFQARSLLNSASLARVATGDMLPTANPLLSVDLTLVVEPRLDLVSTKDWYVFSQARHGAVLMALLNGRLGPVVEPITMAYDVLGAGWRGYIDGGTSLAEWRATVKSVPPASFALETMSVEDEDETEAAERERETERSRREKAEREKAQSAKAESAKATPPKGPGK